MDNWPNVIIAAASGPLGIAALLVLALCTVAIIFFRDAPVWARLLVFVLLILSAGLLFYRIGAYTTSQDLENTPPISNEIVASGASVSPPLPGPAPIPSLERVSLVKEFRQGMNHCERGRSGEWVIDASPGHKIDPASVTVNSDATRNSQVELRSVSEGRIVIEYSVRNDGSCGPKVFGEHVGVDARGSASATVRYDETFPKG